MLKFIVVCFVSIMLPQSWSEETTEYSMGWLKTIKHDNHTWVIHMGRVRSVGDQEVRSSFKHHPDCECLKKGKEELLKKNNQTEALITAMFQLINSKK